MKVYIGPYPTDWLRCRIFSDYMEKKYKYDWPNDQTKFENLLEKVEDSIQFVYNMTINKLLCHRKQKIEVRIDRHDTWSMDSTLAQIIVPMLKQLQESKHGSPYVDDEDVPEDLRSTSAPLKENEYDSDDNLHKRWEWVLSEMIFAFEAKIDDTWREQFYSGEHDIKYEEVEHNGKKLYEMVKGPNDTFAVDREGLDKYHNRMRNGFRLFGKYYEGLWD